MERSDSAFDLDVETSLVPVSKDGERPILWVLETRVRARNRSCESRCLPIVYTEARALVDANAGSLPISHFADLDCQSDRLPDCEHLSRRRNVARLPNSVYQVSPDEALEFIRWDLVDAEFVRRYPAIVIRVEAFTVPARHIGYDQSGIPGPLRLQWLDYMNGIDRSDYRRHRTVIVDRTSVDILDASITRGDRVLVDVVTGGVDLEASVRFREPLAETWQYTKFHTVLLAGGLHATSHLNGGVA
jgi:hypothetical protein